MTLVLLACSLVATQVMAETQIVPGPLPGQSEAEQIVPGKTPWLPGQSKAVPQASPAPSNQTQVLPAPEQDIAPPASSGFYTPERGSAARREIMEAARIPVSRELGQTVIFVVDVVRTNGNWAFLQAVPHNTDGSPFNWEQTRFARDIKDGFMSDVVMVLMRREAGELTVEDYVIGPTDVYWYTWKETYMLPETLFVSR